MFNSIKANANNCLNLLDYFIVSPYSMRVPVDLHPFQQLKFIVKFKFRNSNGYVLVITVLLICISILTKGVGYVLCVHWPFVHPLFLKGLF